MEILNEIGHSIPESDRKRNDLDIIKVPIKYFYNPYLELAVYKGTKLSEDMKKEIVLDTEYKYLSSHPRLLETEDGKNRYEECKHFQEGKRLVSTKKENEMSIYEKLFLKYLYKKEIT